MPTFGGGGGGGGGGAGRGGPTLENREDNSQGSLFILYMLSSYWGLKVPKAREVSAVFLCDKWAANHIQTPIV